MSSRIQAKKQSTKQAVWASLKQLGLTQGVKFVGSTLAELQARLVPVTTAEQINELPTGESMVIAMDKFNELIPMIHATTERKLVARKVDLSGNPKPFWFKVVVVVSHDDIYEADGSDPDSEFDDDFNGDLIIEWVPVTSRAHKDVSFFKHLTKIDYGLEAYQVYSDVEDIDETPCLLFALEKAGVSEDTLAAITHSMYKVSQSTTAIKAIAEAHNLYINIRTDKCHKMSYGPKDGFEVNLGVCDDHIYIDELTEITMSALKNPQYADNKFWPSITIESRGKKGVTKRYVYQAKKKQYLTSHQVIKYLHEHKDTLLTPLTMDRLKVEFDRCDYLKARSLPQKVSSKEIKPKERKASDFTTIVYADLETLVVNGRHSPYLAAWSIADQPTQYSFDIVTCIDDMLDAIPDKSTIWFHNLGFDCRFIIPYLKFNWNSTVIETGNRMKRLEGFYKGKHLCFQDTLSFINAPLAAMPKMFKVLGYDKESFPHDILTLENHSRAIRWSAFKKYTSDHPDLRKNAEAIDAFVVQHGHECLDVKKYLTHYCVRDVDCLRECFQAFRRLFIDEFKQDPINFISLPALAEQVLADRGCFEGCHTMSGEGLAFIREAIVGGRVMCRDNKKWHVTERIADSDVNSLYPAAMARIPGFPIGEPIVVKQEPPSGDYWISRVKVTSVGKHLHFPLQSVIKDDGVRDFTNSLEGQTITLDRYAMEDLLKYQHVEFEVLESLVWNQGFNTKICTVIPELYATRSKYKAEGNPIQEVIKLVLNSSYGKLIQKPIITDKRFVTRSSAMLCDDCIASNSCDECYKFKIAGSHKIKPCKSCAKKLCKNCKPERSLNDFMSKNINRLIQRTDLAYDGANKPTHALFELHRNIISHWSPAHLGVMILSMSKRIMNEAICLAEDIDATIYYQDTDSMHVLEADLPKLAEAYQAEYGRAMIGSGLGQFSSDFALSDDQGKKVNGHVWAAESIFLGKKCYLDRLESDAGISGFHLRMKGMPSKKLKSDPYDLYTRLFAAEPVNFDIADCCPIQINNKTQTVTKRSEFIRTLFFPDTEEQRAAFNESRKKK